MDAIEIVLDFSRKLIEKVDGLIKAIIFFGSQAEGKANEKSDIDILILVDDIYAETSNITVAYYFDVLNELLKDEKFRKLHINTLTLTKFWEMVKNGDPLILDILRKGLPLIDPAGIFGSFKKMLERGMLKPSPEYLELIKRRVDDHLLATSFFINKAFESLYNATIFAAQYFLSRKGIDVFGPEDILIKLEEIKKKYKIPRDVIEYYRGVYNLSLIHISEPTRPY